MGIRDFFNSQRGVLSLKEIGAPCCISIGEVLWDIIESNDPAIPSARHMGGAPANFAYHAQQLGGHCELISATGDDLLGNELVKLLKKLGLSTRGLQRTQFFPTGTVSIQLKFNDEPEYTIQPGVAWDDLEATELALSLTQHADIIYYGTLAQRAAISKRTIQRLLTEGNPKATKIFDVNIRQQFYTGSTLVESFRHASVVKVSDADLSRLAQVLMLSEKHENFCASLFQMYPKVELIAITSGEVGSSLFTRQGVCSKLPAQKINVVDAVGAGDAFTAALAIGWHRHMQLETLHKLAIEVASYVCTKHGATPVLPLTFRQAMGY